MGRILSDLIVLLAVAPAQIIGSVPAVAWLVPLKPATITLSYLDHRTFLTQYPKSSPLFKRIRLYADLLIVIRAGETETPVKKPEVADFDNT